MREVLEAEVSFLDPESGGRQEPPILVGYRPTCSIEGYPANEHVGISFQDGPSEWPGWGVPFKSIVTLLFYPHAWYERLSVGSHFNIREGERVVGRGRVLSQHRSEVA